jgi:hypothetical protein
MFVENLEFSQPEKIDEIIRVQTFIKAHSFCAANRDIYIHEADLRLPI